MLNANTPLTVNELQDELNRVKKIAKTLQKRDTALRKILAEKMWLHFTETSEEETIAELERMFDVYQNNEVLKSQNVQLMSNNGNWFVNKKINAFLEQFNQ